VTAAAVLAWSLAGIDVLPWLAGGDRGLALHAGTNVLNAGLRRPPRHRLDHLAAGVSLAIVKGRISERGALALAYLCFAVTILIGLYLTPCGDRGWWVRGALGLLGGYFYTAPPFHYTVPRTWASPGLLMMGTVDGRGRLLRRLGRVRLADDRPLRAGSAARHRHPPRQRVAGRRRGQAARLHHPLAEMGRPFRRWFYVALLVGAYVAVALAGDARPPPHPDAADHAQPAGHGLGSSIRPRRAAAGSLRSIAMIDMYTARLPHLFGVLLLAGLISPPLLH